MESLTTLIIKKIGLLQGPPGLCKNVRHRPEGVARVSRGVVDRVPSLP
jgi:hypothetical protein